METLTLNGISLARPTAMPSSSGSTTAATSRIDTLADELHRKLKTTDDNDYEPALKAVHSRGRGMAQRILSAITHREHHLLSRNERSVFLLAEFDERVSNIREQFSIPISYTEALASALGIRHPRHEGSTVAVTTDFVFSLNAEEWVAVDFKLSKDLNPRVQEKLGLAAFAFSKVGVPHFTVTEQNVPYRVIQNLRWLHIHRFTVNPPAVGLNDIEEIESQLLAVLSDEKTTIYEAACQVAKRFTLSPAITARVCYWLVANNWNVEIGNPIGPDYPLRFEKR